MLTLLFFKLIILKIKRDLRRHMCSECIGGTVFFFLENGGGGLDAPLIGSVCNVGAWEGSTCTRARFRFAGGCSRARCKMAGREPWPRRVRVSNAVAGAPRGPKTNRKTALRPSQNPRHSRWTTPVKARCAVVPNGRMCRAVLLPVGGGANESDWINYNVPTIL